MKRTRFYKDFVKNTNTFHVIFKYVLQSQNVANHFILKGFEKQCAVVEEKIKEAIESGKEEIKDFTVEMREGEPPTFISSPSITIEEAKNMLEFLRPLNYEIFLKFMNEADLFFVYTELERYLFKSLKYILLKHPNKLKDKMIPLEWILPNDFSKEIIIEKKAEKIIHDLFFKEFGKIFEDIRKFFGIKHCISENEIDTLNEFRQLRNIYIHGDGRVNSTYLSKVKNSILSIGDVLPLNMDIIKSYTRKIIDILINFDEALLKQFPELKD